MLGMRGMVASGFGEVWQYVYENVVDACKRAYQFIKTKVSKKAAIIMEDEEDEEEVMESQDLEVFKKSLESLPEELMVSRKGEIGGNDDVMSFFVEEEGY